MTSQTTDQAIQAMVERLVDHFDPDQIILFGSQARGVVAADGVDQDLPGLNRRVEGHRIVGEQEGVERAGPAALGAVPAIAGRFRYIPRWDQQYFGGSVRLSLAIPVYRIALRTIVFIYKLPLRDLIKLAIGKKKGDQDVQ